MGRRFPHRQRSGLRPSRSIRLRVRHPNQQCRRTTDTDGVTGTAGDHGQPRSTDGCPGRLPIRGKHRISRQGQCDRDGADVRWGCRCVRRAAARVPSPVGRGAWRGDVGRPRDRRSRLLGAAIGREKMKRVPLLIHVAAAVLALLVAGPAVSAWLWRSDAGGLTRIETDSGEVRSLAGFPRADSIEPDREGGAWVRVGAQLIRIDTDLNLALRANLGAAPAASAPMVWDAAARQLWVAHGARPADLRREPDVDSEAPSGRSN